MGLKIDQDCSIKRKRLFQIKCWIFISVLLCLFGIIAIRIYVIVAPGAPNIKTADIKNERILLRRNIVDRNGAILATNLVTYTLYAKPNILNKKEELIRTLHEIFPEVKLGYFAKKLQDSKRKNLVRLNRDLTPKHKQILMARGYIGLFFHPDVKRIYPHRNLFSHLLGYVDSDERGIAGVEKYFDTDLKDKNQEHEDNLVLSLDLNVSTIVHQVLSKTVEKFQARGGVAIVSDIQNGEVLSLISLPDYDPYLPAVSLHDQNYNNKGSFNLYELGSTLKVVTMASGLENEVLTESDKFDLSKPIYVSGFKIEDHKVIEEKVTAKTILAKSSNIGVAQIALKIGATKQKEFIKRLKVFDPLEFEVVEKSYFPMPRRWGLSRSITASYGYGISLTPLHLTQAIGAVVNGGNFYPVTLIKGRNSEYVPNRVISENNSKIVRSMMQEVVQVGTGRKARSRIYEIAGKTGTANKLGKSGYVEDQVIASFVAFFPYHDPKYLVYVLVDDPQGLEETFGYATGGWVAAPAVKRIIERIAPILSVYPRL